MSKKLKVLLKDHAVHMVYPVAENKWIVKITPEDGEIISRRKSPKRGSVYSIFSELIRIPDLINDDNLVIEVLLINMEEIWCLDGLGSWRRKGVSIRDKSLLSVEKSIVFKDKYDFLRLLPEGLEQPFTNKLLAEKACIPVRIAIKMTYCLKKMGALLETGRKGNAILYGVVEDL